MSPHLQVQGGIKMAYQETLALLLPFPHLTEHVTPLPSIKLFYHVLFLDSSIWSTRTKFLKTMIADNICGDVARSNQGVKSC
jgi:hypothetical protein